jgi:hypothetical protein
MAIMSSKRSGFSRFKLSRMPVDSSWNTPTVSALASSSYDFLSSRGSASKSTSTPRPRLMSSTAFCSTVSVFKPRKSNLTRPAASTSFQLYWVTGEFDFGSRVRGTSSTSGRSPMTMPAACVEAWR